MGKPQVVRKVRVTRPRSPIPLPEFKHPDYDRWVKFFDVHYQHVPDAYLTAKQRTEKERLQFWLREQNALPRKPGAKRYVDGDGSGE